MVSAAWERFGLAKGVSDLDSLLAKATGYTDRRSIRATSADPAIGCVVLSYTFFLDDGAMRPSETLGAAVPPPVVKYKTCPELDQLGLPDDPGEPSAPFTLVEGRRAHRVARVVDRPSQRLFRDRVLRAYGRACAVTRETSLEVLKAAHVQPYVDERSNDVPNGIALRTGLHALFDSGLVTVGETMRLRASPRLVSPAYMMLDGLPLRLPDRSEQHPASGALAFHREVVFRKR